MKYSYDDTTAGIIACILSILIGWGIGNSIGLAIRALYDALR